MNSLNPALPARPLRRTAAVFFWVSLTAVLTLPGAPVASAQQRTGQASQSEPERESPDAAQRRIEWFHKQRAYPLGFIPAGSHQKALEHMQRMMETEGKLIRQPGGAEAFALPAPAGSPAWTPIGPSPTTSGFFVTTSGRITTIAVDPSDPTGNTVFIGGAQGGVWKSTDAGVTWTPLTDSQPSLAMGSIAIAPSNHNIIYAGTGEQASTGFDVYYGAGVLKSTDGGNTWTQTGTPPGAPFVGPFSPGFFPGGGARISYLAVHPTNASFVLAGVQIFTGTDVQPGEPGIYCTDNGGSTWSLVLPGAMGTAVAFASPTLAYAALGRPFGDPENDVYKVTVPASPTCAAITNASISSTAPWTRILSTGTGGPAQASVGRIELGLDPTNPNIVYAAVANASNNNNSNDLLGMFKTADGGTTWTQLANTPNFCTPQCWFDLVVRVDPNNSNIVFAGGSARSSGYLIRSTDGGNTWGNVAPSTPAPGSVRVHVDQHAFAFFKVGANVRLYVGNDGGAYRTDDAEAPTITWQNLNSNLGLTQFYPAHSIHPSTQQIGFGGTQDNGTQQFTGSTTWTNVTCGDGGFTAIDPSTPSTVYSACQEIIILKSVQNGARGTFFFVDSGIDQTDNVDFIAPLVIDAKTPQRLYFGTSRLWQTADGAATWNAISPNLVRNTGAVLTAIAVAPQNSGVVYTGANDGTVEVATNVAAGSGTFATRTTGLPPRVVTQIAVDPTDPTGMVAYATFSGFAFSGLGGDLKGHVFQTTNGGVSWVDISCHVADCTAPAATDLPNTPVNDIVIDPDSPATTLYVATDVGVFTTSNAGATWSTLGTGLPTVAVFSLKLREPSRTLRAATHGRSVWDLQLAGVPAFNLSSLSPTTAAVGSAAFTLAVTGNGFTANSKVNWNGSTTGVTTTFVDANHLSATIDATLLAAPGTPSVTVVDLLTSNALVFTITSPIPTLTSITPTTATAGQTADVTITVTGTNFNAGTKVNWNRSTNGVMNITFVSSTQLTATLSHTLFAFGSVNAVTVANSQPGGGPSPQAAAFTVNAASPPPNDNFVNATPVTSGNFTNTVDSFGATTETTDPTPPCVNDSSNTRTKTVWWKFTPDGNGTLTADTIGSSYDTILSAWTGTLGALVAVPNGCNDDIVLGVVQQSRVTINVTAGTTVFFMVSPFDPLEPGALGLGGKTVFNVTTTVAAAAMTASPSSATINAGQSQAFTIFVASAGTPPFSSPVALTVSGCPTASTCALASNSVNIGSNTALNVTTTARAMVPVAGPSRPMARPAARPLPLSWFVLALFLLSAAALAARMTKRRWLAAFVPVLALIFLLVFQVIGCGGGGGGGSSPPAPNGTPAGNYTITVTGASAGTMHSTSVTLAVR